MGIGVFLRTCAAAALITAAIFLLCSSATGEEVSPKDKIYAALLAAESEINVSELGLGKSELTDLMRQILLDSPELFYVSGKFSFSHTADGKILTLKPTYTASGDELDAQRKFYTDTITELLEGLREAASEAERALYIHDTLAEKFDYDVDYKNYDVHSLFVDGRGVCQAYSLAFIALSRKAGIEARTVTSEEMDHAWNIVRVDGKWYHIDVTRDDPISESAPSKTVMHQVFLRSDDAMATLGYHGYESPFACSDSRFEPEGHGILDGIEEAVTFSPHGCFIISNDGARYRIELSDAPTLVPLPDGDVDGNGVADARDLLLVHGSADFEEVRDIILAEMMKKVYMDEILRIRESRE